MLRKSDDLVSIDGGVHVKVPLEILRADYIEISGDLYTFVGDRTKILCDGGNCGTG